MDLLFLTNEKVLTERIFLKANELTNPTEIIKSKVMNQLQNVRHRDGYISSIKKILKIGPTVFDRDSFEGKVYSDVQFLANILDIKTGDILYDCTIDVINEAGILVTKDNGKVKILIPSDELDDIDFTEIYKKGDKINVEVIVSRSIVYDTEIIVYGRIHTYKIISTRTLTQELENITIGDETKDNQLVTIKNIPFIEKPIFKDDVVNFQQFGAPTTTLDGIHQMLEGVKVNTYFKILANPYGNNIINDKIPDSNLTVLEILELFKIFKILNMQIPQKTKGKSNKGGQLNVTMSVIAGDEKERKSVINAANTYSKNVLGLKEVSIDDKKPNIIIVKNIIQKEKDDVFGEYDSKNNHKFNLRSLIEILTILPDVVVFNFNNPTDLVTMEIIFILQQLYQKSWVFKPSISISYTLDTYLVFKKLKKNNSEDIKNIIQKLQAIVSKFGKNNMVDSIFDRFSMKDNTIKDIRIFNDMVYKSYIEKKIETIELQKNHTKGDDINKVNKNSAEINELLQHQLDNSKMWLSKLKLI